MNADLKPDALMEARAMLLDLLLSPYTQLQPWAITKACVYLEHPKRPSGAQCICGKEKFGVVRSPLESASGDNRAP